MSWTEYDEEYYRLRAFGLVAPLPPEHAAIMEEQYNRVKERLMGALKGVELIKAERIRQIAEEGYSIEGDEGRGVDIMRAGNCYQQYAMMQHELDPEDLAVAGHPSDIPWADGKSLWPWARDAWKPSDDPTRNLVKGAALMAAALDVL